MNVELKKMLIQGRIERLRANGKDNYPIVKKLERQLRALGG